jgi:hypothetical protein
MTYGAIKFRLTKAFPGVDQDLIEGWVTDRYLEILGELPWSRLNVEAILQTTAPYQAGTVALTVGSQLATLAGGAFTAALNGLVFQATGDQAIYQFTYASATAGTLDRPYEGATNALATYSIFQNVYPLPADCRFLSDDAFSSFQLGPLKRLTPGDMDAGNPFLASSASGSCGTPMLWSAYMDDGSTPPQMQVKLYPAPNLSIGIPFRYSQEVVAPGATSVTLIPWLQPAALIEGATAKIKAHLKDYNGATYHNATAKAALSVMRAEEAFRAGPVAMRLDGYYTSHRGQRCR